MQVLLQVLSVALAAWIGYVARRASLCTVRAVGDAIAHRRTGMLLSFVRAALWAAVIGGLLIVSLDLPAPRLPASAAFTGAVAGGLLFGVGAAINGGCSLSTLQRLIDGDCSLLLTVLAFCAGVFAWTRLEAVLGWPSAIVIVSPWARPGSLQLVLLAALLTWCGREVFLLSRSGELRTLWRKDATNTSYSSALVGALLGVAGGVLYTVQDSWSYTNYLRSAISASVRAGQAVPTAFHALLVVALLSGMFLASRPRSSVCLAPLRGVWRARLGGGFLMGIGGAVVPGGNDTLVLASIPALSLQALCAYLALLAGIAVVLLAKARGSMPAGLGHDRRTARPGRVEEPM